MSTALDQAVKIVGGQMALAKACGVAQATVWYWLRKSGRAPAEHVPTIEAATNGVVRKHELRPDIWPAPASDLRQTA